MTTSCQCSRSLCDQLASRIGAELSASQVQLVAFVSWTPRLVLVVVVVVVVLPQLFVLHFAYDHVESVAPVPEDFAPAAMSGARPQKPAFVAATAVVLAVAAAS